MFTDFDLPQALDNALTLVRERAGRRGIALHQAVDERLGEIRGDERKVKQEVGHRPKEVTEDHRHIMRCVREVLALPGVQIDPARVLIAGYSVGGSAAPYVATHEELFTARPPRTRRPGGNRASPRARLVLAGGQSIMLSWRTSSLLSSGGGSIHATVPDAVHPTTPPRGRGRLLDPHRVSG